MKIKIASIIITYNRVGEVKAQMDIIRELWQPIFETIDIYHEFNGEKSWYPKKYHEDFLHRHRQMGHFVGANHMLNEGFKHVLESGRKYDFIIATSADTWFYNPRRLKEIIMTCHKRRFQLATSLWLGVALATEFFIITPDLAKKVFPLKPTPFINRYKLLKWANSKISIENIFTFKVMWVLKNPNKIYLIPGRRVVLLNNRHWSPNFYASHHDPKQRRKDILPKIRTALGDRIDSMTFLNRFL